jgi:secondary thiamine-phosphate synthase enzyme
LHTSASLTLNENWDKDVREDMENSLNRMIPDSMHLYKHADEGADDMPAHIKSSLIGNQFNVPIHNGNLVLGTWQGIWLCEHRDYSHSRNLVITLHGLLK